MSRQSAMNGTPIACLQQAGLPASRAAPARRVFIDETSVKTNMTPLRGRSVKGKRLPADAPFGKWHTQTFIAGLRCHERVAPWVIEGAINGEAFDTYVTTQLAPQLKPGDVVVLPAAGRLGQSQRPQAPRGA